LKAPEPTERNTIAVITPGKPAALSVRGNDVASSTEAPMASTLDQINVENEIIETIVTYIADQIIML
jgi:hypothetical protein